ncbi:MAG: HupE/UreJ family protein [Phormidesmis sp.]
MRNKAMPVQPRLESNRKKGNGLLSVLTVGLLTCMMVLAGASAASAHHPFGGTTPSTLFEGFLSGVGHPLIGPDHFAFIVAVGLLAVVKKQGMLIPIAFVLSSLAGTGLHLASLDLPAPEFFVSASVLLFGVFLAMKQRPTTAVISGLAVIAGLFHGYAYGEAIIGAQMTPLVSYLAGFTLVQLGVSITAFKVAKAIVKGAKDPSWMPLRFAGFTIGGIGAAFLSSIVLG